LDLGHDINEEYSQEGKDIYNQKDKDNMSFFVEIKEQPGCVDEANETAVECPHPVPSIASTAELLGLDCVFDDLGHVLRMSSYHLHEHLRINYKE
jgi:hypothetical protein